MKQMINIYLSYPCYSGHPWLNSIISVLQAIQSSQLANVKFHAEAKESLIPRVRNNSLSDFYFNTQDDLYVSIDDDIQIFNVFPKDNLFDKFVKGKNNPVQIGLYAKKTQPLQCASHLDVDYNYNTGLKDVVFAATGCMCITRQLVKDYISAYPDCIYDGDGDNYGKKLINAFPVGPVKFKIIQNDKEEDFIKYLSEDYYFSQLVKDMGFKLVADTSIMLSHDGYILFNNPLNKKEPTIKPPINQPPSPPVSPPDINTIMQDIVTPQWMIEQQDKDIKFKEKLERMKEYFKNNNNISLTIKD